MRSVESIVIDALVDMLFTKERVRFPKRTIKKYNVDVLYTLDTLRLARIQIYILYIV